MDDVEQPVDKRWRLFLDLYNRVFRHGPGDDAATRRALNCVRGLLPEAAMAADFGAGCGAASLLLASELPKARIFAIDIDARALGALHEKAAGLGYASRISPIHASMTAPPFRSETFDLIWSEGAVYIAGFEAGLRQWRSLLKPGGCVAVTEVSWTSEHRPSEVVAYWAAEYPAIAGVDDNIAALGRAGYELLDHLTLPPHAWLENYYAPLLAAAPGYIADHGNDPVAVEIVDEVRRERAVYEEGQGCFGYEFYIGRRLPNA